MADKMLAFHLDIRRQSSIDCGVSVGHILLPQGRVLAPSQGTQGAGVNILRVTLPAKYIRVFYKDRIGISLFGILLFEYLNNELFVATLVKALSR